MNNQGQKCEISGTDYKCKRGPPYDGFYSVNEKQIVNEIGKYS